MESKSNLKLVKTLWGVPEAFDKSKWSEIFAKIKNEGFAGVEMFRPLYMMPGMKEALDQAGLFFVAQIHTSCEDISKLDEKNQL
jgi:sugar phosphate isomerase/epimerase